MNTRELQRTTATLLGVAVVFWAVWGEAARALSLPLDRLSAITEVELQAAAALESGPIPISALWRLYSTVLGVRTWQVPLPVRPRALFYYKPPEDMALLYRSAEGKPWTAATSLKHSPELPGWSVNKSWTFTSRSLQVRRRAEQGPPAAWEYAVRYGRATDREGALRPTEADVRDPDFVLRSAQVDDTTRHGLYLPAPGLARFDLQVPEGAVLELDSTLLPPEAADPATASDGATLVVELRKGDTTVELARRAPQVRRTDRLRLDLAAWGGQDVSITLRSEGGEDTDYDYLFVADPIIRQPEADPQRVVILFIDTLRADHLSLYGYDRPTSPNIDAWAAGGTAFTNARSVAPWTLPSSRTMLTGVQPESWGLLPTLQERFREAGWATGFFAGNVYLSSNFEMADGWGTQRCVNWPGAEVEVSRARRFLRDYPDRSAFVVVHFMDMHLPYREPLSYRRRFAGERPPALAADNFQRTDVVRAEKKMGPAGKEYVMGRYDNSLAYLDDSLSGFLRELGEDTTVVLLSDHGEEFWDHGGFEHGHTLYDELLRIPLVLRGPGIPTGTSDTPVSLLDVAPTLAKAAGLSTEGMTGIPLQDLLNIKGSAEISNRPLSFGRPLYGERRWGVIDDGKKYTTTEGEQALFDLRADPQEQKDIAADLEDPTPWARRMSQGLGRPVGLGLRLVAGDGRLKGDVVAELDTPGGWAAAVVGDDPLNASAGAAVIEGTIARLTWKGGHNDVRELYAVPARPMAEALPELVIRMIGGETPMELSRAWSGDTLPTMDKFGSPLFEGRFKNRSMKVTWALVPIPPERGRALSGMDGEMEDALKALGYMDDHPSDHVDKTDKSDKSVPAPRGPAGVAPPPVR